MLYIVRERVRDDISSAYAMCTLMLMALFLHSGRIAFLPVSWIVLMKNEKNKPTCLQSLANFCLYLDHTMINTKILNCAMYGNDSKGTKVRTGAPGHNCSEEREDCELKMVVCTKIKIWMPLFWIKLSF